MYRILLVEDEERIRKGLKSSFPWERCGCVVVGEASNGQEGIEQIRALDPDIVLTDVSMPLVSGLDMLKATAEEFGYAAIVLSVYSEFDYARTALKLGAIDYLLKPLQPEELKAALAKAIVFLEERRKLSYRASEDGRLRSKVLTVPQTVGSGRVRRLLKQIEDEYANRIRIGDLSEELNTSSGYLNQLFKEHTGYTYNDYLNRYRILKAMDLLDNDIQKVYQIAEEVGFSDYKYFVSVFEKYTGMTPTEYKKTTGKRERTDSDAQD